MTFGFGKEFRVQVFGESHGDVIGVVLEGCPPGLMIDTEQIQRELDRRRPGSSALVTSRSEADQVQIQSGILNGKTTGAPITMTISNTDVDSSYYEDIKHTPRPGHADYTARVKYDGHNDYRGGGTFSGRMTAALVMAGSIARSILKDIGIEVIAHILQVGSVKLQRKVSIQDIKANTFTNETRCADIETSKEMETEIASAKQEGDSIGGIIECQILDVPAGFGEPFFDSIESLLSHAMFSIPGVKGIEFGSGFRGASLRGSENNDSPTILDGKVGWTKNDSGGILGGISNGAPIEFRVALKPPSSISKTQQTIDLARMADTSLQVKGRHDPCIAPRAVPVIEGLAAIVVVDLIMRKNSTC